MRKILFYAAILLVLCGCGNKRANEKPTETFTTEVILKTTPVKDQGKSSLCWVYAMLATFETEHLMQGDSVNLSPDYVARMFLREQACERTMSRHGGRSSSCYGLTTRGMATMVPRLIYAYGLQHYDAYRRNEDCNYNVLARRLQQITDMNGRMSDVSKHLDALMDETVSPLPLRVYMYGAEYTPLEFAHSVCRDHEYTPTTSYSHHPFGSRFVLEVPDNRYHDMFLNVPLDTMMSRIETSLRNGHPVCWEGDTSEPGFDFLHGVARVKHEDRVVTQEQRQFSFETGLTTDDHCMEMVGIAHDTDGKKYFICKNSWGTGNPYGGFMYLSENYVRLKTIAVMIRNEVSRTGNILL